ncbi:hypothetical protein [Marinicrinis lubricantis]|uniref:Thioredoxin domain-containing protein n=1 Tax=Marinicrinis lubricantis TaxID=2086470 RepID=A0ABW1IKC3_9BACL
MMSSFYLFSHLVLWSIVFLLSYIAMIIMKENIKIKSMLHEEHEGLPKGIVFPLERHISPKQEWTVIAPEKDGTLIFFTSCYCDACKKLYPIINELYNKLPVYQYFVYISGPEEEVEQLLQNHRLDAPIVRVDNFKDLQTPVVPFAYFISSDGIIQAKGIVNSENHIHTLISKGTRQASAS